MKLYGALNNTNKTTQEAIGNDGTYKALAKLLKQDKMFEKQAMEHDFMDNHNYALSGAVRGALMGSVIGGFRAPQGQKLKGALMGGAVGTGISAGIGGIHDHYSNQDRDAGEAHWKATEDARERLHEHLDPGSGQYRYDKPVQANEITPEMREIWDRQFQINKNK